MNVWDDIHFTIFIENKTKKYLYLPYSIRFSIHSIFFSFPMAADGKPMCMRENVKQYRLIVFFSTNLSKQTTTRKSVCTTLEKMFVERPINEINKKKKKRRFYVNIRHFAFAKIRTSQNCVIFRFSHKRLIRVASRDSRD